MRTLKEMYRARRLHGTRSLRRNALRRPPPPPPLPPTGTGERVRRRQGIVGFPNDAEMDRWLKQQEADGFKVESFESMTDDDLRSYGHEPHAGYTHYMYFAILQPLGG